MYLSEYMDRKKTAENILEPRLLEKQTTLPGAIAFLKEQEGLPYPDSWFLSNPERTMSIYKKKYIAYWKQFVLDFKEYDSAQKELQLLEVMYQQNQIINDLEVAYQENQQIYY